MPPDISTGQKSDEADILVGGHADKSRGYFIDPTVIVTTDPHYESMTQEIFAGPVLTLYKHEDAAVDEAGPCGQHLPLCPDRCRVCSGTVRPFMT